jgi:glycerol-3-phosphate dehydrogenase
VLSYLHLQRPAARRGHLQTLLAEDRESGETFPVRARAVVNCTGPFSDAFRGGTPVLRPTLGVHAVFEAERLPTAGRAIVINSPRDGRLIFTLPAGARTIVGTTDTDWHPPDGSRRPRPQDEIRASGADVDYLLEAANHAFPPARLTRHEVVSTFAGLRPLISSEAASTSATSREHEIWIDRQGLLTVAGGKLTTMRRMGEEAVDRLIDLLQARGVDRPLRPCRTHTRPLPGAVHPPDLGGYELASDVKARLQNAYGARAGQVAALAAANPRLSQRLAPDLPYLRAEVIFAVRHDLAVEVEDVLRRRVPLFRDAADQGLSSAEAVGRMMEEELGWTPARRERSVADYRAAVTAASRWRTEPR